MTPESSESNHLGIPVDFCGPIIVCGAWLYRWLNKIIVFECELHDVHEMTNYTCMYTQVPQIHMYPARTARFSEQSIILLHSTHDSIQIREPGTQ